MRKTKNHLIKYLDIYIIILTGIVAIVDFYLLNKKVEILIAIISIGISIGFGLRQYRIENDKIFKELFVMFNDKYDMKFNNCLNNIIEKTNKDSTYELNEEEKPLVIDYLNMCAEEYLWFTKGRIDSTVWESWQRGMKYYLEIQPIHEFIKTEKSQKDSYYGIFEYLKL